jgi:hypothetical protein
VPGDDGGGGRHAARGCPRPHAEANVAGGVAPRGVPLPPTPQAVLCRLGRGRPKPTKKPNRITTPTSWNGKGKN